MATEQFQIRFTESGVKEVVRGFNDTLRAGETVEDQIAAINKELNATTRYASRAQRSYENYARANNAVDKAQRTGIISATEAAARVRGLGISYQAQLRPISTLISKIDSETLAFKANKAERIATLRTIQQVVGLQRVGINATEAEIASIQKANQAYSRQRQAITERAQAQRNADRILANSGTAQEQASARLDRATTQLADARRRGVISAQQEADATSRLTRQYAEQYDPMLRLERLANERLRYQRGLFQSGSNLGQVERELQRLQSRGVVVDNQRAASLRKNAIEADRLQRAYQGLNSAGGLLSQVLGGVGLAFAASTFTREIDKVITINNRLALVASSTENANRLFQETADIATRTRSDFTAVVEGYSRIARSTKLIGLGQRDALRLTEATTQALQISGASAQEATATLVQFGQALASNRLGGDELRSVLEQGPRLAQGIVDGINILNRTDPTKLPKRLRDEITKTGAVNIGTLRDLAKEGLITAKVVSDALLTQTDVLAAEFAKTTPTISQSFNVLRTEFSRFLNDFNNGTGAGGAISKGILFIARNLETIVTVLGSLGALIAITFAVNQVTSFINFAKSLPSVFGATTVAVNTNAAALDRENASLIRNTAAQAANRNARAGVGVAAAAGTGARVVQGGGAAVAGVAAGLANAAPKMGVLATATGKVGGFLRAALVPLGAIITLLGGPISAAIIGILAIGTAFALLGNKIKVADDQLLIYATGTTQAAIKGNIGLLDVATGVFNTLIGKTDELTASQLAGSAKAKEGQIADQQELSAVQQAAQQAKLDAEGQAAVQTFSVYETLNDGIAKSAADLVGNLVTGATYISGAFVNAFVLVGVVASNIFNSLSSRIAEFYNTALLPIINKAAEFGIGSGGSTLSTTNRQIDVGAASRALDTENLRASVTAGRAAREGTARAISSAAANRQRNGGLGGLDEGGANTLTDPAGSGGRGRAGADAAKALASAYRTLRDELDPLAKITEDYEADTLTLNRALASGLVTQEYHADLISRLTKRYQEASDPIGALIRDQERENAILGLNVNLREAATLALQRQIQLERQLGRDLTAPELARVTESANNDVSIKRQTDLADSIKAANDARDIERDGLGRNAILLQAEADARATVGEALRQGVVGAQALFVEQVALNLAFAQQKQIADQVEATFTRLTQSTLNYAQETLALNTLLEDGRITLDKYERELRAITSAQLGENLDLTSGVARGILAIKAASEDLASGIQTTFEDAYAGIRDGFVSIFTGDDFDIGSLFKSITANLASTLFDGLVDPLVSRLGQSQNIAGFGGGQDTAGQTAAAQTVAASWQAASLQMQTSYTTALSTMTAASNTFALNQQAVTGQVVAGQVAGTSTAVSAVVAGETTKNGVVAAGAAITAGTEAAKTGAVVAGAATRTGAEVAASATSKTLTIGDALMSIGANAVKAATGAYAAISGIPVVGPFLAPAVAAAALAAVFGLGKSLFSAEQGVGSVANDGDLYSLHKKEMVLPANIAGPLRSMLTTPGGRDVGEASPGAVPQQAVVAPDVNIDQKTVNVIDPQMALDALNTTAGQRLMLNFIQSNPTQVRRALGI